MVYALRIHKTGGPEVLTWEAIELPPPGQGEARVRHTAIGLNYIDTYYRSGLYPVAALPAIVGGEAAGVVEAVGAGVGDLAPGDRVAYGAAPIGAYAEARNIPADRLVKLPAAIDDRRAASMMLKGMTAWYLLRRTFKVEKGHTILVHAAAGGVGLIMCQWAKHLGATVIGTVGSKEKAELAAAHGCDHPILYREVNFAEEVRKLTKGEGVPVVYDSVGVDTFMTSLDCIRPLGLMVTFGQSSGAVPPFNTGVLAAKGSLFLTRPTLFAYVAKRPDLLAAAADLFDVVTKGIVRIEVNQTYALKDAAQAHADLQGRKTTGSTVLLP